MTLSERVERLVILVAMDDAELADSGLTQEIRNMENELLNLLSEKQYAKGPQPTYDFDSLNMKRNLIDVRQVLIDFRTEWDTDEEKRIDAIGILDDCIQELV